MARGLLSPLPPEECVRRLRGVVGSGLWPFSSRRVVGHVGRRFLWLRMRGAVVYRNSMQPYLFARLTATPGGTRLRGRFLLHPVVLLFLLMVALVAGFLVLVWRNMAPATTSADARWLIDWMPAFLLAAVAAIVGVGSYFARNDRENLMAFLRETLDARNDAD